MPNTDHYQKIPDFFPSAEEGRSAGRANTNPRYKFFRQTHFTAGDYEQFLAHWDTTSHEAEVEAVEALDLPQLRAGLHGGLRCDDIIHTFEYIFHKHKKGIFFKIVRNELRVFLPFSKVEYTNDWAGRVRADPKRYKGIYELLEASCANSGHAFDANRVHFMRDHWYANNGLLRYEYPISENDSGVPAIRDMLLTLCRERVVPDGEYFINKRDFPILKRDRTEAHECIYGEDTPLTSHRHEKYCPILSMTTTDAHADIPIPTWDDWGRASYPDKLFGKDFLEYPDPYVPDYHGKKDTAVFRGASTGLGTTPEDNPRLRFAQMSRQQKRDEDGVVFLDCAITKWNCRPRKTATSRYYDTIHRDLVGQIGVGSFLTMREQAQYKFILHLPGHSEAYRLPMELATGSVVLLYPCRYKLWFSSWLRPHEHYIPLDPDDPDDVYKKIKWCKAHPDECAAIASNARRFYEEKLSKAAILDYWRDLLCALQGVVGKIRFPPKDMFAFQEALEKEALSVEKKILLNDRLFPPTITAADADMTRVHPRTFQVFLHRLDPDALTRQIEEAPVWKQSRNVAIRRIVVAGRALCVKTPNNVVEKDILHECFIGQVGVNKLANACPMIAFQHGRWGNHIVEDFVEGETLEKFLCAQKPDQVCGALKLILCQVSLLLHHAQSEFGFLHYDLYPWNIIVRENREGTTFTFPVCGTQKAFSFRPPYYPVLIDFGKSHIVYKNMHFANVSPFQLNLHQDALSILISSLFTVVQNHKLPPKDVPELIRIVNYVGKTRYAQHRVFDNMAQVKQFLRLKKKFSNMLSDDKSEFKDADPLRLFEHIRPTPNIFRCHKNTSELAMSLEIYYSRFTILHELSAPEANQERRPQRHKNPINAFFHGYLDYMLTSRLSPGADTTAQLDELIECCKKDWKVRPPTTTTTTTTIPRFFSHPDAAPVQAPRSVNHYYEIHKVSSIVAHAAHHVPQLSFLADKAAALFAPYAHPILTANLNASAANHMSLYHDFISTVPL